MRGRVISYRCCVLRRGSDAVGVDNAPEELELGGEELGLGCVQVLAVLVLGP